MSRPLRIILLALAAQALLAPSAIARPWRVETVQTTGAAVSRGVDVLPDGRTAILVQRRTAGAKRLELRIGRRTRLLDSSPLDFPAADLQHDKHGRLVAMWVRRLAGKATRVSAWTAAGGRQEVGDAGSALPTLAASAGGRAAIAWQSQEGTFVARGAARRGFQKAERADRAAGYQMPPGVAVTGKGRTVVAWIDSQARLLLRRADPGAPFGPAQVAQLRAQGPGTSLFRDSPSVATTRDGRAVVVIRTVEFRAGATVDARVEALDWPVAAARPSPAATLSRSAGAGPPALLARGATAVIAWTQRPKGAPRALWAARWTAKGLQKPSIYDTHALASPILLTTARHGAVDAFYRAGGLRWFTVRLSAAGRYSGTSAVTRPNEPVVQIDAAAAGSHAAALWSSGRQVRLARPAR